MLRRAMTVLLIVLLPSAALSQPVYVQSGEHETFSRLVTPVPPGKTWRLEQSDGKATLHLEGHQAGFDTSRVFDFIPRDRVSNIESNQNQLSIFLGCECKVTAFAVEGNYVAVDVTSVQPAQGETSPPSANTRPPSSARQILPTTLGSDTSQPRKPSPLALPTVSLTTKEASLLSNVETDLVRELSSALSRGVLQAAKPNSPSRGPVIDEGATPKRVTPQRLEPGLRVQLPKANMRISTSKDWPSPRNPAHETISDQGLVCPPDDSLEIASWGDDRPFDIQVAEARIGLFGEFDVLDPEAALELAQVYLFFGFGAEARQVLGLDQELLDKHSLLVEVASLMSGEASKASNLLRQLDDCDGNVALWSALANQNRKNKRINPAPVLLALSKLPFNLRKYIAPMISDIFLTRDDAKSAAVAMRSLERQPETLGPAAKLAQANITIDEGDKDEGTSQLEAIAGNNSAESPRALVALVNVKLNAGQAITPETIELIDAYAEEFKGTEIEQDLQRVHILSLSSTGQFDRALSKINDTQTGDGGSITKELHTQLFRDLTENASDIEFLDIVLQQIKTNVTPTDAKARMALASRLLALGFATDAQQLISDIPAKPIDKTRQILAAQTALALDQPFQAQAALLGVSGEAATKIRADAKRMTGAHAEAHALYQDVEAREQAAESAWLAENWRALTPSETPVFGPVSALPDITDIAADGPVGMLERTETALNESATARRALNDLLSASNLTQ